MRSKNTQTLGRLGENIARKYLEEKGFLILETNFKNPSGRQLGEIDIIAGKNGELFFVEVKTRKFSGREQIQPEQNITRDKMYKLSKISQSYLRRNRLLDAPHHFDAISILYDEASKKAQLRHLRDIFF